MGEELKGSVHIAEEVVASVASLAAVEVDGVGSLLNAPGTQIPDLLSKKSLTRGVKIAVMDEIVTADIYLLVKYGYNVQSVAIKVQNNVKKTLESMTGMSVSAVNVHVGGITLTKEPKKSAN